MVVSSSLFLDCERKNIVDTKQLTAFLCPKFIQFDSFSSAFRKHLKQGSLFATKLEALLDAALDFESSTDLENLLEQNA